MPHVSLHTLSSLAPAKRTLSELLLMIHCLPFAAFSSLQGRVNPISCLSPSLFSGTLSFPFALALLAVQ